MNRIYLDHAATTPMRRQAVAAVAEGMARWANPSSPHAEGRAARAALEDARARIKAALGWRHHLIFTSGASEALDIAITRQAGHRPVLISAVEHLAALRSCPRDTPLLPVGADGRIDPEAFGALLRGNAQALVVVQSANSETGIVQPVADLIAPIDLAGGLMLVDCSQTAGWTALPEADLMVVSAHKLGGPPGIAALLVRDWAALTPRGGGQEQGYRIGTENVPAALGFAAAVEAAVEAQARDPHGLEMARWRILLDNAIQNLGGEPVGGHCATGAPRIPAIGSYRIPGIAAQTLLIRMDMAGFAISAGSACSSGSLHASHVLLAMEYSDQAAREVFRVSFGWPTTWDQIDAFCDALHAVTADIRARAA